MTNNPLQERILDAVEQCFSQYGIQKTTLADVAAIAGVSRVTLYRQFRDRQALFDGAALRNIRRHWRIIGKRLAAETSLAKWLIEALLIYQSEFSRDASVALYRNLDAFSDGFRVALSPAGLAAVTDQFQALFDACATDGLLPNGLCRDDIAEWLHRFNYSQIKDPSPRLEDPGKLRLWISVQVSGGLIP